MIKPPTQVVYPGLKPGTPEEMIRAVHDELVKLRASVHGILGQHGTVQHVQPVLAVNSEELRNEETVTVGTLIERYGIKPIEKKKASGIGVLASGGGTLRLPAVTNIAVTQAIDPLPSDPRQKKAIVTVTWNNPGFAELFHHVKIAIKGYHNSSDFAVIYEGKQGDTSAQLPPLDITLENVTIAVMTVAPDGTTMTPDQAPKLTFQLTGGVVTPPATGPATVPIDFEVIQHLGTNMIHFEVDDPLTGYDGANCLFLQGTPLSSGGDPMYYGFNATDLNLGGGDPTFASMQLYPAAPVPGHFHVNVIKGNPIVTIVGSETIPASCIGKILVIEPDGDPVVDGIDAHFITAISPTQILTQEDNAGLLWHKDRTNAPARIVDIFYEKDGQVSFTFPLLEGSNVGFTPVEAGTTNRKHYISPLVTNASLLGRQFWWRCLITNNWGYTPWAVPAPNNPVIIGSEDTANPSGASDLTVIVHGDPGGDDIPGNAAVFEWNRETANYLGVKFICVILSNNSPAPGPYPEQITANNNVQIDPPYPQEWDVKVLDNRVDIIGSSRLANPALTEDRPLIIYEAANPATTIDGNRVKCVQGSPGQGDFGTYFITDAPFTKAGTFKAKIIRRYWDLEDVGDLGTIAVYIFAFTDVTISTSGRYRTPPVVTPTGSYHASAFTRGTMGLGTLLARKVGGVATKKVFKGNSKGFIDNLSPSYPPYVAAANLGSSLQDSTYKLRITITIAQGDIRSSGIEMLQIWGDTAPGPCTGDVDERATSLGAIDQVVQVDLDATKFYSFGFRAYSVTSDGVRHYTGIQSATAIQDLQPNSLDGRADWKGRIRRSNTEGTIEWDAVVANCRFMMTWVARGTIPAAHIDSSNPYVKTTALDPPHGLGYVPGFLAFVEGQLGNFSPAMATTNEGTVGPPSAEITGNMTADAAQCSSTTIGRDDANWPANFFKNTMVRLTGGQGAGQLVMVSSSDSKKATTLTAMSPAPNGTTTFRFEHADQIQIGVSAVGESITAYNTGAGEHTVKLYLFKETPDFT